MPGTDGQGGAQPSATTLIEPELQVSTDEGLTRALSAFMAQLQSGADRSERSPGRSPVPDISARPTPGRANPVPSSARGATLPHRTPGATQQATKAAFSPLRPMTGAVTGKATAVDAWSAAAVLAGQWEAAPAVARPTGPSKGPIAPRTSGPGVAPKLPEQSQSREQSGPERPGARPQLGTGKLAGLLGLAGRRRPLARRVRAGANRERIVVAGTGALVIALLGASFSWGVGESSALARKTAQLEAARATLGATVGDLADTQKRASRQLRDLNALESASLHWKAQAAHLQAQLVQAQAQLTQAQQRVGAAQGQLDQAQGQLGDTQRNLYTLTRAHAGQCQRAAVLAQNSLGIYSNLAVAESEYLTALEAHKRASMSLYMGEMSSLQVQATSTGTDFSSTMNACLGS